MQTCFLKVVKIWEAGIHDYQRACVLGLKLVPLSTDSLALSIDSCWHANPFVLAILWEDINRNAQIYVCKASPPQCEVAERKTGATEGRETQYKYSNKVIYDLRKKSKSM